jgi:hypothetical protein
MHQLLAYTWRRSENFLQVILGESLDERAVHPKQFEEKLRTEFLTRSKTKYDYSLQQKSATQIGMWTREHGGLLVYRTSSMGGLKPRYPQ